MPSHTTQEQDRERDAEWRALQWLNRRIGRGRRFESALEVALFAQTQAVEQLGGPLDATQVNRLAKAVELYVTFAGIPRSDVVVAPRVA